MGKVLNVHSRLLPAGDADAETLLRSLASHEDRLWPGDKWWPQHFEGGLRPGSKGGHGPVKYKVESVEPRKVLFRFPRRGWFQGTHAMELRRTAGGTELVHTLEGRTVGVGRVLWPLVVRPLHDALLEDLMDRAEASLGQRPAPPAKHSWYVRHLRRRWLKIE